MARYCSTRDGRTRAPAPKAPHLTWTATIPITDGSPRFSETNLTTDAEGYAYVSSAGGFGGDPSLRRIDTARGAIDWTVQLMGAPTPLLVSTGKVEIFDGYALTSIDAASGSQAPVATLHFYETSATDPAIASDGSLFFVYGIGTGTANPSRVISRARPDGTGTVDLGEPSDTRPAAA